MHELFMRRCFELARLGTGRVSPNPLVGAVIVKNNKIIAEGFHARHGAPHAEADAFSKATEDVSGATLYCNLEPCCHTKKLTPPCAPAIISKKIAHVVIANLDPNPAVAGQGVRELQDAGIKVTVGVLEKEGEVLNEIFFHRMRTGRPFVHLKAAATLDGKVALLNGESKWITGEEARLDGHRGRLQYDAIVVGAETVRLDSPALTVRLPGVEVERMPWRIVLTGTGMLPPQAPLFTDEFKARTLIVAGPDTEITVVPSEQVIRLTTLTPFAFTEFYSELAKRGIHSLWLEGGASVHTLYLEHRQVQRVSLYLAPKLMGTGRSLFSHTTPSLQQMNVLDAMEIQLIGTDVKITGKLTSV
jgi:diaminohydroxyphosphoribosylaminopyrimidine deaminase/5-amino-6-(5-phosphoribosylamino)uracil reductase